MEESNPVVARSSTEEGNETIMSRKEKKKLAKKKKRQEKRKEMAEKEREEVEARANDAEEQRKLEMMMKEEEEKRERALKEFEEREKIWIQEMELKKKEEENEEEERRKVLEEREKQEEAKKQSQVEKENECDEDDDWEYVEEGPAEIIWQGNEIIIRKKKVRVPKKDANQLSGKGDMDGPTSNPLPPQSEAFTDYQNAQQALENVARQVPNFGTEQDKAHCPFHLKTGACRFGQRCSRVHFYPDKSCTLLIKNMYNGPGLAWEQDEGLEIYGFTSLEVHDVGLDWVGVKAMSYSHTDEEVDRSYEEFYEDVHTEFLKFGEIVNFKVCRNGSSHLRGNVYVHFKSLESAVLAYCSVNGRYFAGKQVTCEFVNVTRWKVAICGEFMKSRLKTCSRGMACNFIHCFRNPGGDYEWADWDKPPPRYWMKKMSALFGYSDESGCWKQMEQDHSGQIRNSNKIDRAKADGHQSRRSRSRSHDCEHHVQENTRSRSWRDTNDNRKRIKRLDEKLHKEGTELKDNHHNESRSDETNSDGSWSDRDGGKDRDRHHGLKRKHIKHRSSVSEKSTGYRDSKDRIHETDYGGNWSDGDGDAETRHVHTRKSLRYRSRGEVRDDKDEDSNKRDDTRSIGDWSDGDIITDRYQSRKKKSSSHQRNISKSVDEDGVGNYRTYYADSADDLLDREYERHHSRRRKRSRHRTEESEFSDDQGEFANKLKKNCHNGKSESEKSDPQRDKRHKHSSRRSHSRKEKSRTNNSIAEQDRWNPINAEEDRKSMRKASSIYESGSPGRYSGRSKSPDFDAENYNNEMIDGGRWESKEVSKQRHESRSNSSDDQDQLKSKSNPDDRYPGELYHESRPGELYHESRSRDGSLSSRERQTHCSEMETRTCEKLQDREENYKSDNAKHRSHRHRRRHDKGHNF